MIKMNKAYPSLRRIILSYCPKILHRVIVFCPKRAGESFRQNCHRPFETLFPPSRQIPAFPDNRHCTGDLILHCLQTEFMYGVSEPGVSEEFFLNNEMPERTRRNFMEVAFSARMCCACLEIFCVHSCL